MVRKCIRYTEKENATSTVSNVIWKKKGHIYKQQNKAMEHSMEKESLFKFVSWFEPSICYVISLSEDILYFMGYKSWSHQNWITKGQHMHHVTSRTAYVLRELESKHLANKKVPRKFYSTTACSTKHMSFVFYVVS